MFMKTQQTPISLSSGIWFVTLSAFFVCFGFFSYANTFEVCFKMYLGAHFLCILLDHLISTLLSVSTH